MWSLIYRRHNIRDSDAYDIFQLNYGSDFTLIPDERMHLEPGNYIRTDVRPDNYGYIRVRMNDVILANDREQHELPCVQYLEHPINDSPIKVQVHVIFSADSRHESNARCIAWSPEFGRIFSDCDFDTMILGTVYKAWVVRASPRPHEHYTVCWMMIESEAMLKQESEEYHEREMARIMKQMSEAAVNFPPGYYNQETKKQRDDYPDEWENRRRDHDERPRPQRRPREEETRELREGSFSGGGAAYSGNGRYNRRDDHRRFGKSNVPRNWYGGTGGEYLHKEGGGVADSYDVNNIIFWGKLSHTDAMDRLRQPLTMLVVQAGENEGFAFHHFTRYVPMNTFIEEGLDTMKLKKVGAGDWIVVQCTHLKHKRYCNGLVVDKVIRRSYKPLTTRFDVETNTVSCELALDVPEFVDNQLTALAHKTGVPQLRHCSVIPHNVLGVVAMDHEWCRKWRGRRLHVTANALEFNNKYQDSICGFEVVKINRELEADECIVPEESPEDLELLEAELNEFGGGSSNDGTEGDEESDDENHDANAASDDDDDEDNPYSIPPSFVPSQSRSNGFDNYPSKPSRSSPAEFEKRKYHDDSLPDRNAPYQKGGDGGSYRGGSSVGTDSRHGDLPYRNNTTAPVPPPPSRSYAESGAPSKPYFDRDTPPRADIPLPRAPYVNTNSTAYTSTTSDLPPQRSHFGKPTSSTYYNADDTYSEAASSAYRVPPSNSGSSFRGTDESRFSFGNQPKPAPVAANTPLPRNSLSQVPATQPVYRTAPQSSSAPSRPISSAPPPTPINHRPPTVQPLLGVADPNAPQHDHLKGIVVGVASTGLHLIFCVEKGPVLLQDAPRWKICVGDSVEFCACKMLQPLSRIIYMSVSKVTCLQQPLMPTRFIGRGRLVELETDIDSPKANECTPCTYSLLYSRDVGDVLFWNDSVALEDGGNISVAALQQHPAWTVVIRPWLTVDNGFQWVVDRVRGPFNVRRPFLEDQPLTEADDNSNFVNVLLNGFDTLLGGGSGIDTVAPQTSRAPSVGSNSYVSQQSEADHLRSLLSRLWSFDTVKRALKTEDYMLYEKLEEVVKPLQNRVPSVAAADSSRRGVAYNSHEPPSQIRAQTSSTVDNSRRGAYGNDSLNNEPAYTDRRPIGDYGRPASTASTGSSTRFSAPNNPHGGSGSRSAYSGYQ